MTKQCECGVCNATEYDILERMVDIFDDEDEE